MKKKREELQEILDRGTGERELLAFLKENPFIITESLSFLGHPTIVVAEFPIGQSFIADFMVIAPYSGAFDIKLIEIEPPLERIFAKNGVLARRANKALEQVNSWATYIRKNRIEVLRAIEKYGKEKDLINGPREKITCTAGCSIFDSTVDVHFNYEIIIGRRDHLSTKELERKTAFKENNDVQITTTDRLFSGADKIDQYPHIYE
jgi:hypothetical protein